MTILGVHPLIALGVLASTTATDAAYVFFNAAVSGRRRVRQPARGSVHSPRSLGCGGGTPKRRKRVTPRRECASPQVPTGVFPFRAIFAN